MKWALTMLFLCLGALQADSATNVQAILTFNATTLGAYATDAEIDASIIGPVTSTTPADSTFLAVTNWPYRFPNWFQVGGTNFEQASSRWIHWEPTNNGTGAKKIEVFTPGSTWTNGWMQGFMRLDITNSTSSAENYDVITIDGGGPVIMQVATINTLPTGIRIYAHNGAGGSNGWSFDYPRNKLVYYSVFRDPANNRGVVELFDPTNNFSAITNLSGQGTTTSVCELAPGGGNTFRFWLQAQYLPISTPPKCVGTNWFSSVVYGYGSMANPVTPPVPETNVIVSDYTYPFVVGATVGVRGGIPARTGGTTIDVTQAPYGVDKTGITNATTGLNAAAAAASSNDVVYLPAGVYNCVTNGMAYDVAGVEIRGELTNGVPATTIVGNISIGHSASGQQYISLTNGGWKGSSNLVLSATNTSDGNLGIGDLLRVSDLFNSTNADFIVRYNAWGGAARVADEVVTIIGFNGHTVNISAPLVYYFTNASTAKVQTMNIPSLRPKSKMGLRDLRIAGIWPSLGYTNSSVFRVKFTSTVDSYLTNCIIEYPQNYCLNFSSSSHFTIEHVLMQHALSIGTSRSGLTLDSVGHGIVHNNVFYDLTIGWQVQGGSASAMAFAYNFYTNISDKAFTYHGTHHWFSLHEGEKVKLGNVVFGDGYFGSSSHHYAYRCWLEYTVASKRWAHRNQFVRNFLGDRTDGTQVFLAPRVSNYPQNAIFEDDFPHLGNKSFDGTVPNISFSWPGKYTSVSGTITNPPLDILITITTNVLGTNLFDTSVDYQRWTTNYQAAFAVDPGSFPLVFQDASNTNLYWIEDAGGNAVTMSAAGPTNITLNQTITVSNGWKMFMGGPGAYNQLQTNTHTHIRHANTVYTNGVGVATTVLDPVTLPLTFRDSMLYSSEPGYFGDDVYPADGVNPIPAETWFYEFAEVVSPTTGNKGKRVGPRGPQRR